MIATREMTGLVAAATAGDERAWERLIGEFTPLVRGIARRHRLSATDQDEVLQRTWIALVRYIGRLQNPACISGWLATTAGRESLRVIADSRRLVLVDELPAGSAVDEADAEAGLLEAERRDAVRAVAGELSERQRTLVETLTAEPQLSYEQVGARLGMPVGSVGPTRQRCVERMRRDPRIASLSDDQVLPGHPTRPPRPVPQLV